MSRYSPLPIAALLAAAACTPAADSAPPAPPTVDVAAARAATDSVRNRYIALQTAGDATGLAALFSQDAGVDLYGAPRVRGRTALEAFFKADFAARKYTLAEITPGEFNARTDTDASELGTYHDMHDAMGTKDHEWGRYLVALGRDTDGQWRINYLIAFPDSTKVEK
jgi:ketosteroid isomerase-like protein